MQQETESQSLDRIAGILRRRLPLVLVCMVLVAGAAYFVSKRAAKKYTASASLVFNSNSLSNQVAGLTSTPNSNSTELLAQQTSNLELVKGAAATVKTASALGLPVEKVAGSVSVAAQGETGVIDVSATSPSPKLAASIANTYAETFVKEQAAQNHQYLKSALALVNKQISKLGPQQRSGAVAAQLQNRAETLSLLAELNYSAVQVGQLAGTPSSPSSPRTSRNAELGLLVGLLLGLAISFALERLDRRIKTPEELEGIYQLPLLGSVPETGKLGQKRRKGERIEPLPAAEAEAFSLIRAHLRFFNINRELRAIVIASAAPGDGKTTVSCHLAEAAAAVGSRVLLLEADLRHPTLTRQFDLPPGPGLADVLIGASGLSEATRQVALPGFEDGGRTLDVLTAGSLLPPNPGELLASQAMSDLLQRAKATYDLVVIDTPPLAVVADAFPLLTDVDGVVIVGWISRSKRDAARRLHQVVTSSGVPLLGVIANGAKRELPASYIAGKGRTAPAPAKAPAGNDDPRSQDLVPAAKA